MTTTTKTTFPLEGNEVIPTEEEILSTEVEVPLEEQFKKKKKKKKKKVNDADKTTTEDVFPTDEVAAARIRYLELLEPFYDWYRQKFPEQQNKKHGCTLPEPEIINAPKRVILINFQKICQRLNRPTEHVMKYICTEFGTSGDLNGHKQLVIRGRFKSQNMKSILTDYVKTYVRCKTCLKTNTEITRDRKHDISLLKCLDCGATSSVTKIQAGYRAISRADRKKIKNP